MEKRPRIFGVDFGTTNCCISTFEDEKVEILKYLPPDDIIEKFEKDLWKEFTNEVDPDLMRAFNRELDAESRKKLSDEAKKKSRKELDKIYEEEQRARFNEWFKVSYGLSIENFPMTLLSTHLIPSIVHFYEKSEEVDNTFKKVLDRHVGHLARMLMVGNPFCSVHSIKRLLGKHWKNSPEIQPYLKSEYYDCAKYLAYQVKVNDGSYKAPENQSSYYKLCPIVFGTEHPEFEFNPIEITTMIFERIKEIIVEKYGDIEPYIVVGIPGSNEDDKAFIHDLKLAIEASGCHLVGFVPEPLASAIAYSRFPESRGKVVGILDVGGGTSDFSIVYIDRNAVPHVAASGGLAHLGGDDFDYAIVEYAVNKFMKKKKIVTSRSKKILPWQNPSKRYIFKNAAELAKINLTFETLSAIRLTREHFEGNESLFLDVVISLDTLNIILDDFVQEIIEMSFKVFDEAQENIRKWLDTMPGLIEGPQHLLKGIIFSGGQSRMPYLQKRFCKALQAGEIKIGLDHNLVDFPDQSIAIGLALHGKRLLDSGKFKVD